MGSDPLEGLNYTQNDVNRRFSYISTYGVFEPRPPDEESTRDGLDDKYKACTVSGRSVHLNPCSSAWRNASRWAFPEEALDERSDAPGPASRRSAKAAGCREAALEGLADGEFDLLELGTGIE